MLIVIIHNSSLIFTANFRANAAWEAAKEQTSGSILQKEEITTQLAEMDHEKKVLQSEVNLFIGNIANILSSPTTVVEPTLDAIRDHVKQVHGSHDSNARAVKILEQKLIEVTQQLEKQCELHTETLRRAKRLEDEKNTHQDRFITIEDNLATASVLNTTLQGQRDRFTAFLQDLADALKLTGSDTTRDLEVFKTYFLKAYFYEIGLQHNRGYSMMCIIGVIYLLVIHGIIASTSTTTW